MSHQYQTREVAKKKLAEAIGLADEVELKAAKFTQVTLSGRSRYTICEDLDGNQVISNLQNRTVVIEGFIFKTVNCWGCYFGQDEYTIRYLGSMIEWFFTPDDGLVINRGVPWEELKWDSDRLRY